MAAAAKKPAIDLALIMGGDKGAPAKAKGEAPMTEEATAADEEELPAGFAMAAEEFLDQERPLEERTRALHRAIKACSSEY